MKQFKDPITKLNERLSSLLTQVEAVQTEIEIHNNSLAVLSALDKPGSPFPHSFIRHSASRGPMLMLCREKDRISSAQLRIDGPSMAALMFIAQEIKHEVD